MVFLTAVLDDAFEVVCHQVPQGTFVGQAKAVREHNGCVYDGTVDQLEATERQNITPRFFFNLISDKVPYQPYYLWMVSLLNSEISQCFTTLLCWTCKTQMICKTQMAL